jgi:diguanylate cyclase (GGDEF)-like protein
LKFSEIKKVRPASPIIALILLFVAVLSFSLLQTTREADRVDAERTSLAVTAAMRGEVARMQSMADDNAFWDDAVKALYSGGKIDRNFVWNVWGVSSGGAQNYDGIAVLDHSGRTLVAYRSGKPVQFDVAQEYGAALVSLLAEVDRDQGPKGGLIKTRRGVELVGLSDVRPTTPTLDVLVPDQGHYRLLLTRTLTDEIVTSAGETVHVDNLSLTPEHEDSSATVLRDASGNGVATVFWKADHPGMLALQRALPWIIFGSLLFVGIASYVILQGFRTIRRFSDQALIDSLSRLPNRRALRQSLEKSLSMRENLALAMIDLDGFKGINDNYGHGVGDRLIKEISALLLELVGGKALVVRLGGDEFAIMATGADSAVRLESICGQIITRLSHPFRVDERTVLIGASIGIASAVKLSFDAGELMRRADIAMYSAKRAGKMRVRWYDEEIDQKQATAHSIEMELRQSIESDQFELVYQPFVSVGDGRIMAVEALLRWTSPTRGPTQPSDFIPVAEETGLIDRIGMWVLRRACTDGMQWPGVSVAVNVSAAQLRNPDYCKQLTKILSETGFPAERLELEITETYLVVDPEVARRVLDEIHVLGVQVSLDDFGTGYASIGFMRQFAFNKLKIDRSLVNEAEDSEPARAMLAASVALARSLNMTVAAEGVETERQAALMRVMGCDQLQGWHYSRAESASAITARVTDRKSSTSAPRLRVV